MTVDNTITLLAACLAFVASIISISIAAYNARFKRFARERWWDRRADTYSKIVEIMSKLVEYYEARYNEVTEYKELSEARKKEIEEYWRTGYFELKRISQLGAFLISKDVENILVKIFDNKRHEGINPNNWFDLLETDYVITRDCLKEIVYAAKRDLGVL